MSRYALTTMGLRHVLARIVSGAWRWRDLGRKREPLRSLDRPDGIDSDAWTELVHRAALGICTAAPHRPCRGCIQNANNMLASLITDEAAAKLLDQLKDTPTL